MKEDGVIHVVNLQVRPGSRTLALVRPYISYSDSSSPSCLATSARGFKTARCAIMKSSGTGVPSSGMSIAMARDGARRAENEGMSVASKPCLLGLRAAKIMAEEWTASEEQAVACHRMSGTDCP